jgi:hypothetical protein
VRGLDGVAPAPLDSTPPVFQYGGEYFATWLEDLVHNPYQFYAKHILRLRVRPDIGDEIGAKEFGTLVHGVLEACAVCGIAEAPGIDAMLVEAGGKLLEKDSVLQRFWHNRFHEIAPVAAKLLSSGPASFEEDIEMDYFGRKVRARADRVERIGSAVRVVDYKTGAIPSNSQLGLGKDHDCTMPQLPVEALILREAIGASVSMAFLRLQRKKSALVEFDEKETAESIKAAESKMKFLFAQDTYARPDHYLDEKYRDFDDLCRLSGTDEM